MQCWTSFPEIWPRAIFTSSYCVVSNRSLCLHLSSSPSSAYINCIYLYYCAVSPPVDSSVPYCAKWRSAFPYPCHALSGPLRSFGRLSDYWGKELVEDHLHPIVQVPRMFFILNDFIACLRIVQLLPHRLEFPCRGSSVSRSPLLSLTQVLRTTSQPRHLGGD
jgi:hypothetical protein